MSIRSRLLEKLYIVPPPRALIPYLIIGLIPEPIKGSPGRQPHNIHTPIAVTPVKDIRLATIDQYPPPNHAIIIASIPLMVAAAISLTAILLNFIFLFNKAKCCVETPVKIKIVAMNTDTILSLGSS